MSETPEPVRRPTFDEAVDFVKILYYGTYGSAKTISLASLAKLGRVVYINAEGGIKKRALRNHNIPASNIEPRRPQTYEQLDALFWEIKERLTLPADDPDRPVGVHFDSVTEIQKQLVEARVDIRVERAARVHQEVDPFFIDRDDYGVMTEQLRRLVRKFRDLPCHVGFSALEKRETDGEDAIYRAALTPAFTNDLAGYVDIVIRTIQLAPEIYVGVSQNFGRSQGKDRFGVLPPVMAEPTLDRIVAMVNDELDLETDPAQMRYLAWATAE